MKKCKYCGKEYKENNKDILENLPVFLRENLRYIPDCNCLELKKEKEFEKLEKQYEAERRKNRVNRYKSISIIDDKFYSSRFENADEDNIIIFLKKYADKFLTSDKVPAGLYLYGNVGTGKTYGVSCLANKLMEKGKTVLIMNLGLYLVKIKSEFKVGVSGDIESEILNFIKECDLLIIDDLGVEKNSEFVLEKVFNLIDTRYRTNKPMIITSNLSLDDMGEGPNKKFDMRIKDRILGSTFQFYCAGSSKRKVDKKEFLDWLAN